MEKLIVRNEEYITATQAAEYLGVSSKRIYKLAKDNRLRSLPPCEMLISFKDLKDYKSSRKVGKPKCSKE